MSYSIIPELANEAIETLTRLGNGNYSVEHTIELYQVLKLVVAKLDMVDCIVKDRSAKKSNTVVVTGVSNPIIIKGDN